jgi:hypothetical protein
MEEVRGTVALEGFTLTQMLALGTSLREIGKGAKNMQEAADRIVRHLYECLISAETGHKACALVRFFKTHPFGQLDEDLRHFARARLASAAETPAMKCLVLLATAGDLPDWNSTTRSKEHRAIPLPNEEAIKNSPMISQLLSEMGLNAGALIGGDSSLMLDTVDTNFNVFHVPEAQGNPYVPAQDFVTAFGVKSALGFGGLLPSQDVFAVILFSKTPIPRATAEFFKTLGLMIRLAISPFDHDRVFATLHDGIAVGQTPVGIKRDSDGLRRRSS